MTTFGIVILRSWRGLILLATTVLTLPLVACDGAASATKSAARRSYGAAVVVGAGTARSYVTLEGGVPTEVGVALSERSLLELPAQGDIHDGHLNMNEWVLPLPEDAARTPYQLIVLGWNPQGHEPPGIYDLPHFDFHFYTTTLAERNEIDPALASFEERASRLPAADLVPAGYVGAHDLMKAPAPVATVPRMGLHWLDPKTPELNGQKFTTTFIYGSYDGKLIFGEPMITKAFIESRPEFSAEIGQPQRFGRAGYYPTRYLIRWDEQAREYRIALSGFAKRDR